ELFAQLVEQFRVTDRVLVGRLVVDGIDDADAEEVAPNAVGAGAGEVGMFWRRLPFGVRDARIDAVAPLGVLAGEETGRDALTRAGDLDLASVGLLERLL